MNKILNLSIMLPNKQKSRITLCGIGTALVKIGKK